MTLKELAQKARETIDKETQDKFDENVVEKVKGMYSFVLHELHHTGVSYRFKKHNAVYGDIVFSMDIPNGEYIKVEGLPKTPIKIKREINLFVSRTGIYKKATDSYNLSSDELVTYLNECFQKLYPKQ